MHQPKIISIISTFSSEDWRECGDFLKGRLRAGHDCITLYNEIRAKNRSSISVDRITQIKQQLFPEITPKSYTNLLSKLTLKLEEYLVFSTTLKDHNKYELTLLKSYTQRGLFKLFDKKAEALEEEIKSEKKIALFDQLDLLQINHLRYFSDNPIKNKKGNEVLYDLDLHHILFQKQYELLLNSTKLHYNEVFKKEVPNVDTSVRKNKLSNILDDIYQYKNNPDEKLFDSLFHKVTSHQYSIEIYSIVLGFLIHRLHRQVAAGHTKSVDRLLDLYEWGFDEGILLSNNHITENRFINVISTASATNKFERATSIIDRYGHLIEPSIREGTVQIAYAHITFYRGDYNALIEQLRDYPFNTFWQNLRRRWMLICAYYKVQGEYSEFMQSHISSFNKYFYSNKNKISKSGYEGSLNLGKVISRMQNRKTKKDIYSFINSIDQLIYRKWVIKELQNYK